MCATFSLKSWKSIFDYFCDVQKPRTNATIKKMIQVWEWSEKFVGACWRKWFPVFVACFNFQNWKDRNNFWLANPILHVSLSHYLAVRNPCSQRCFGHFRLNFHRQILSLKWQTTAHKVINNNNLCRKFGANEWNDTHTPQTLARNTQQAKSSRSRSCWIACENWQILYYALCRSNRSYRCRW